MNYIKINITLILPVLILLFSCNEPLTGFSRIEYNIPEYINIKADDLIAGIGEVKTDPSSSIYIVVVLYSYSAGAETISFSGGEDIKTVSGSGRLKALVKVMDGKKIIRAEFTEGRGKSKEEILSSLVKDIKHRMMEYL